MTLTVWGSAAQDSRLTSFHLNISVFLTTELGGVILPLPLSNIIVFGWNFSMPTAALPWQAAPSWLLLSIWVYKQKLQTLTSINTHFLQIVSSESREDPWSPMFVSPSYSCFKEGGDHMWFLHSSSLVLGTE